LLEIDRPEVEIEVPEWIAEAEEIIEAQEMAESKLNQVIAKAEF
jgi:hypothetical protein